MSVNPTFDINSVNPAELLKLVKAEGGQRAFARKYDVPRTTLQDRLYLLRTDPFGHRPPPQPKHVGRKKGVRRFILSSAQDQTAPNEQFLRNLEAYRDWLQETGSCEIMIGPFTYGKSLFEDHATKTGKYHERIKPYLVFDRIRIADRIDFCGEMNTLPTAENPLAGFHTYTRERWGIFPHAKVQLDSVPVTKGSLPKQVMTTGSVTKPNYIPKRVGIKASFHHVYAAVLVEIDGEGDFFCRHLIADDSGTFYDLDRAVEDGVVTVGHRLEALTPGDIHVAQIDPSISATIFGFAPCERAPDGTREWFGAEVDSVVNAMKPKHLFIHDVSDFRARNHHEIMDPHKRFRHYIEGTGSVGDELEEVSMLLSVLDKGLPDTNIVVVESNHDQALLKWLKFADYRFDPENAEFFLTCQLAQYQAIRERNSGFSIFAFAMKELFPQYNCDDITFLREDQSYVIGGIEHSMHGHRGSNGARGSVANLSRLAPKITMGHVHSPAIRDGLYASGTTSLLDMGYNVGPGSWAHTMVFQYANGKRALVTVMNEKWRV